MEACKYLCHIKGTHYYAGLARRIVQFRCIFCINFVLLIAATGVCFVSSFTNCCLVIFAFYLLSSSTSVLLWLSILVREIAEWRIVCAANFGIQEMRVQERVILRARLARFSQFLVLHVKHIRKDWIFRYFLGP